MTSTSISQQIYDEFIKELKKQESIPNEMADSLKSVIQSGAGKKKDILKVLQKEEKSDEDT